MLDTRLAPPPAQTDGRSSAGFQQKPPFLFLQIWLIIICVCLFLLFVAWDQKLLAMITTLDRSYMSTLIMMLAALGSIFALWHLFRCSRWIKHACDELSGRAPAPQDSMVYAFNTDLPARNGEPVIGTETGDAMLEIYADQLRSPVETGWFLVDLAIRMGLLGTIIGFILIFTSLSGSDLSAAGSSGADGLSGLLVAMSAGMGTALFTTLTGLVAATFLNLQFLVLGRAVEHLLGLLVRIKIDRENLRHGD